MSIDQLDKVSDPNDVPIMNKILDNLHREGVGTLYTDTVPTASTTPPGKLVIYDNGSGTKRVYFKTGKDNLGYIALT